MAILGEIHIAMGLRHHRLNGVFQSIGTVKGDGDNGNTGGGDIARGPFVNKIDL